MNEFCTIQLYLDQHWIDCAIVELLDATTLGWEARTRTSYLFEYAISHMQARDIHALSFNLPVNVQSVKTDTWPAFLMDLLPQGHGRKELLKELKFSENAQQHADWALLKAGAGNPIGHLRVKEAHEWLNENFPVKHSQGFSLEEITQRKETFIESLASYGLFIAGSSGVQGEWPKLLLTQAQDGLYYLDHTLADEHAKKHWLVKFSRGHDPRLEKILSQEALYMQLARHLDLRVYQDIELHKRTLFIPRFDRKVTDRGVERISQESIAALSDQAGFGVKLSHNQICQLLANSCTHPETEIIEYLKRDIANVALGNKDNHTRNTAIQRSEQGLIQLTPVFDFAPMWLHPDGIARTTRWERDDQGGSPQWS
ncbi:serine/threonine-protein kinase HipA [Acinetobacter calcoaceticus]|uniref:Serine/threonine-protein kinase HipA n=1 Tax=Acinetobacter calcoaceticus TaxID=471 RepID=A0A4R1Y2Y7_ACICA|nr:serine/threonine-protein kinase HipA [Acinetobacter calcoaceticus]